MSIKTHVEDIAKAASLTDPQDLSGLVNLQKLFEALADELGEPDLATLGDVTSSAVDMIGQIVMREIEDVESTFEQIHKSIEYAQEVVNTLGRGESVADLALPGASDAEKLPDIDEELLSAWLSCCSDALATIEGQVLEIESEGASDELLAEIRRGIHTLKGECGVLSLGEAQKVCHEAESLIDRAMSGTGAFPVDAILAVLDWMKTYHAALSEDFRAAAPEHADLLTQLVESNDATAPEAESAAESIAKANPAPAPVENTTSIDAEPEANDPLADAPVEFPPDLEADENINDFLCEAREHIAGAEEALLSLEQDFSDSELINTVFRAFHTIKGVAGFMNLAPIVELAHNAEFLLDEARKTTITLNSAYLDLILNSCDLLSQLIAMLEGADAPTRGELNILIEKLKRAAKGEVDTATTPAAPKAKPAPKTTPEVMATPEPMPESTPAVIESKPAAQPAPAKAAPAQSAPTPQKKQVSAAAKKRTDQTVKVNTMRLDNLVTMVGELVIAQQMVVQDEKIQEINDQRFQRNLGHSGKIIRDLQEVAMSLRMVTLKGIFQKMARLVRDVSAKAGKDVQFHMEGEDTELDRNVVEEIGDPLVHMIRNSCDHGIETGEKRRAAGKQGIGNLTLRAYHQGGSIIIEVEDDGNGLDRDRILKKAIERGIYTADRDHSEIPDSEIYNLIMMPGFSTAEKVTDISGRGVGMDVVRRNIEALRGKVEINSTPGKGSTFRITLPLTMAIIDGMIVRVGEQRYVIPTLSIEQSFRPTANELHSVVGRGEMVTVRESLLPIHRLNQIFNLNEGFDDISDALLIVLESNDSRCCLLVDEILGQQQVVIKSLGQGVDSIRGVSGGAILGDGRVALIIDVGGLINQATSITA